MAHRKARKIISTWKVDKFHSGLWALNCRNQRCLALPVSCMWSQRLTFFPSIFRSCYHWDDNLRPPLEISNLLKNPEVRSVHGCWMFGNERMSEWGLKTHHIENPATAAAAAANSSAVRELSKHWLRKKRDVGHLGRENNRWIYFLTKESCLFPGEARTSFSVFWPVLSEWND